MNHWAFDLIGTPWSPDGQGPETFSCWGLVRHVFLVRHGVEMPLVRTGESTDQNVGAIKRAASASGFRLADQPAQDGDIVLMMNTARGRHVGVMVAAGAELLLLHAEGWATRHGNVGSVIAQPLAEAMQHYTHPEFWRHT